MYRGERDIESYVTISLGQGKNTRSKKVKNQGKDTCIKYVEIIVKYSYLSSYISSTSRFLDLAHLLQFIYKPCDIYVLSNSFLLCILSIVKCFTCSPT